MFKISLLSSEPDNSDSKEQAMIINIDADNTDCTILAKQSEDLQKIINSKISQVHQQAIYKKNYKLAQKRANSTYRCMEQLSISKEAYYFCNLSPFIMGLINFLGMCYNDDPMVKNLTTTAIVSGIIAIPTWGTNCVFSCYKKKHSNAQQEMKSTADNYSKTVDLTTKTTYVDTNKKISQMIFKYAALKEDKEQVVRDEYLENRSAPTCQPHYRCCK